MSENGTTDGKVECKICGSREHVIKAHLERAHPEVSIEKYQERFPDAPLLSPTAIERLNAKRAAAPSAPIADAPAEAVAADAEVHPVTKMDGFDVSTRALHQVFGLGSAKAARGHANNPIGITCVEADESLRFLVHEKDDSYVFNIELLKTVMMGIQMGIPTYLWGHMGTGKSTIFEQVSARTGRPMMRVQHTMNTEESHVIGMWGVKDGATRFELGPLPFCMKFGLTYLADEYDFAMPAVLALYQPVLEGKPLLIKEADPENRVIKPHPLFRFVATGNTNGTGDETGLYQGTRTQNAANYERFGIVEEVRYMDAKTETAIIIRKTDVKPEVAEKLVEFARLMREAYTNGKIALPVSPRALINAAKNGTMRRDYQRGVELSYINRLSRIDAETAREVMNRIGFKSLVSA